ncbi:MAG: hypoxanthine phosphoribosyltransferase [Pedobacter sp.]
MSTHHSDILLSENTILTRVGELARQISLDYADVDELLMVGVLRGCYIFLADLSRALSIPRRIDFMALSSYGNATTSGAVRLIMDLRTDIAHRHVLIVEDIVDTGRTLDYLLRLLRARNPASLKTCSLLRKAGSMQIDVPVDYLGFDIPDVWIVGYGLDCGDRYRALPYIAKLPREGITGM